MQVHENDFSVSALREILTALKPVNHLEKYKRAYRIEVDGLEIVPLTTSLAHFSDYLFFSSPDARVVCFIVYYRHKIISRHILNLQPKTT
ncbi:MAG: hypothetical protein MUC87_03570 [Bacteroidia bacterium]|jgi:hypothetical protein|nr:hypothetical protein [Bacteroidia bacterium]